MIKEIKNKAFKQIEAVGDKESLEQIRIKYLGRKGELTQVLRGLKDLSIEQRRKIGPQAQKLKKELEDLFEEKIEKLKIKSLKLKAELDITKPAKKISIGHLNPLTKIEEEVRRIFLSMNFSVVEGPEVENEFYHFDALNIPKDHPARDAWNTFWLKNSKLLLRAHTSPMQVRYMETHQPPFQIIVPGRVFRYEATDVSHETTFTQVEGLMVGENISLANFKFIIERFLKELFGEKTEFELRPSYYPFTEPGMDVYMKWHKGWLEVAGAGMVHPEVFRAVGYDPYKWQGFAFGFGLNRLVMIKYKIPDIRLFYSGDLRFIKQF